MNKYQTHFILNFIQLLMRFPHMLATLFLMASAPGLAGQNSNLAIYSSGPEPFAVFMNGTRLTQRPSAHFRITGIPPATYDLRLEYGNASVRPITTQLTLLPGRELTMAAIAPGTQTGKLVFMNEFSLTDAFIPSGPPVTVECPPLQPGLAVPPPIVTIDPVPAQQALNPLPGYTGPVGCQPVINDVDFENVKASIQKASYAEGKMTIAKQVSTGNCLLSRQVVEVMDLFSFESDKLEFAKFAYARTFDLGNYYKVNDAFKFSSSIDELTKFIQGQ